VIGCETQRASCIENSDSCCILPSGIKRPLDSRRASECLAKRYYEQGTPKQFLPQAQREPVVIEKKKRRVAVVLSVAEYDRLQALEEAYWAAKADSALKEDFLGVAESAKVMERLRRKNA